MNRFKSYKTGNPLIQLFAVVSALLLLGGCGDYEVKKPSGDPPEMVGENSMEVLDRVEIMNSYKKITDHNPIMVQRFGADPYALVYDGRVYIYMTGDKFSYEPDGSVKENTYGNINTINVVSSDDLVNWTDHGSVYAAGTNGAASWGANSWAPAAAYKKIDGKDKFFLYFANNGNGIAVLTADSPVGPFTDPLNGPLISRDTPTCAEVTWLFDPAVLMDDDGECYIYFGGGIPSKEKASNPGTARVAKLGKDMISIDGDPKPIENVPYLFEDSGINKIGGVYYYSYCSNFDVPAGAESELGFSQGEIVTMKSDSPMGPFELCGGVLKNPQVFFGQGGNNHHCMFEFNGEWYITYHSRILENEMGILKGYRSTNIDSLMLGDDLGPAASIGTRHGVEQIKSFDPYKEIPAVTTSNMAGLTTTQYGEVSKKYGSGEMVLTGIQDGAWTSLSGVEFGNVGASAVDVKVLGSGEGFIRICIDTPSSDEVAVAHVSADSKEPVTIHCELDEKVIGKHNVFFVFAGEEYQVYSYEFVK
ncbi:MAG: family 43 glycosylhydrolase [Butyrivibrio sp.]|uniref:glycoside hydrolase family 43 protein n=1 Tax=Butyrivibrio sp. TaxID=28121 RepID=UPI001B0E8382|nr:glycoside hydrolase family 43 protein [Butyrivibrio sp.]MBO6241233.1 family 43 glycosylhydrolase [Butyrivibrio sp.]